MRAIFLSFVFIFSGCATTSSVTIESNTVSEVYQIDMSDPEARWQKIGQTPYQANIAEDQVVIYRVTGEGGKSKYLVFPTTLPDGSLTLNFDLVGQGIFQPEDNKKQPEEEKKTISLEVLQKVNQSLLTTLQAYAALWERKPESARELAQEAEAQYRNLVGPPLIEALAAMMENNRQEAAAKLTIAKDRHSVPTPIFTDIEKQLE